MRQHSLVTTQILVAVPEIADSKIADSEQEAVSVRSMICHSTAYSTEAYSAHLSGA